MMAFFELMKETYTRRGYIRIVHICWILIYMVLFCFPFSQEVWQWGPFLLIWSGCLLPILLSAGVFGDDIASGRIALIITKPIPTYFLFLCRACGLLVQSILHFVIVSSIIFVLHRLTNRGDASNLLSWTISSFLLSATWITLSTTLSVLVKREHNAIVLILATIGIFVLFSILMAFYPDELATKWITQVFKYIFPPVGILFELSEQGFSYRQTLGVVLHLFGLLSVYSFLGIYFLSIKQFNLKQD